MPGRVIEVDEEEYRASTTLRDTVAKWMKNPAARRKMLEAHRAADPKAEIPELDQPDPVDAKLNPVLEELKALRKEQADDKEARAKKEAVDSLTTRIESGFKTLRAEHGLTAEGEASIRKLMEDEGITNVAVAWNHFNALHPPQAPINPGIGGWNFAEPAQDQAEDFKKLFESKGENDALTMKIARDVLTDIRGSRR
jgi:hypothetical protein